MGNEILRVLVFERAVIAGDSAIDNLLDLLGGRPDHFGDLAQKYGRSMLAVFRLDRTMINEVVFSLLVRYGEHSVA